MSLSFLNTKNCNNYEDTVQTLNGLISNAKTIANSIEKVQEVRLQHIPLTKVFCERAGVQLIEIDELKIVHVAGTKGKGSTCTYIDAILHQQGFKTGLFTSPHLTEVRERIKINGQPLPKSDFCHHFWHIYDRLCSSKMSENDMPFYFQFLTILAFHVFLEEKVDYVVLETGIGGRFDSTNIISSPKIACITSLGFDHMEILGDTMKEIAWNKAGIIKPKCLVVTCNSQPRDGIDAILSETHIHNNKLFLVPAEFQTKLNFLKFEKGIYPENALLASAVCHLLLHEEAGTETNHIKTSSQNPLFSENVDISNVFDLPLEACTNEKYIETICTTTVTGRYQKMTKGNVDYFIDGAHTIESIKTCVEWFQGATINTRCQHRFLVFMITGRRSAEELLSPLTPLKFDGILLAPLVPFHDHQPADFAPDISVIEREKSKLADIGATWSRLNSLFFESNGSTEYFNCFQEIEERLSKVDCRVQVLVTGSLHLVGCALAVLGREGHE